MLNCSCMFQALLVVMSYGRSVACGKYYHKTVLIVSHIFNANVPSIVRAIYIYRICCLSVLDVT